MKRRPYTCFFLCLSNILLIFGITGLLGGIFGHAWWVDDLNSYDVGKFEHGILRYKHEYKNGMSDEGFVKNVFKFKKDQYAVINGQQRDVILLCFIISAIFAIFAIFPTIFGTCRMKESSWDFVTMTTAFLTAMGAIPSIGSMIYIEIKYRDVWGKTLERKDGWSYILAWFGAGSMFFSSIFSFIMIFLKPRKGYSITPAKKTKTNSSAANNAGYEKENTRPIKTVAVKKGGNHVVLESSA